MAKTQTTRTREQSKMIKRVEFISRFQAAKIKPNREHEALISIAEPGEDRDLHDSWKHFLHLDFHDTDAHANNGKHWSALPVLNGKYTSFDKEHANQIIKFVSELPNEVDSVIVHCHAGISRSAAVARFIADMYFLEHDYGYDLYNRRVYSTLRNVYYGGSYDEDDVTFNGSEDVLKDLPYFN
jgi:predicted protein tyrosine phosphatase